MQIHVTKHAMKRWKQRMGAVNKKKIMQLTREKHANGELMPINRGALAYEHRGRKVIVRKAKDRLVVVTIIAPRQQRKSGNTIKIEIPGIPPSWNQIMRMHHMQQHKEAQQWYSTIALVASTLKRKKLPIKRARVTLRYRFPDRRRRDPDNYSGKFIMDGLTLAGIIEDDSFDNIQLTIERGEPVKGGAVEIEIEDVA